MGYTTDFTGRFKFNKPLDKDTLEFLIKLSDTRRMKRDLPAKYGVEGEFYVEDDNEGVLDQNHPPKTQPGLWLQWVPTPEGKYLEWNGAEKFYEYIPWLKYLIAKVLKPRGYKLSGVVHWVGEDNSDIGTIQCEGFEVYTKEGEHSQNLLPVSVSMIKSLAKEKTKKKGKTSG